MKKSNLFIVALLLIGVVVGGIALTGNSDVLQGRFAKTISKPNLKSAPVVIGPGGGGGTPAVEEITIELVPAPTTTVAVGHPEYQLYNAKLTSTFSSDVEMGNLVFGFVSGTGDLVNVNNIMDINDDEGNFFNIALINTDYFSLIEGPYELQLNGCSPIRCELNQDINFDTYVTVPPGESHISIYTFVSPVLGGSGEIRVNWTGLSNLTFREPGTNRDLGDVLNHGSGILSGETHSW